MTGTNEEDRYIEREQEEHARSDLRYIVQLLGPADCLREIASYLSAGASAPLGPDEDPF